jgi:hypothetical protein
VGCGKPSVRGVVRSARLRNLKIAVGRRHLLGGGAKHLRHQHRQVVAPEISLGGLVPRGQLATVRCDRSIEPIAPDLDQSLGRTIWDTADGHPIGDPLTGHTSEVNAVAVGRLGDRDVIVSGGDDKTLRIWDPTGHLIGNPLSLVESCAGLAFGAQGIILATGNAVALLESTETRWPRWPGGSAVKQKRV